MECYAGKIGEVNGQIWRSLRERPQAEKRPLGSACGVAEPGGVLEVVRTRLSVGKSSGSIWEGIFWLRVMGCSR